MAKGLIEVAKNTGTMIVDTVSKPPVLTGIAIVGTLGLIPLTIQATVKSMNDLYDLAESDPEAYENLTKWGIVKREWPNFIGVGIDAFGTIFLNVASCKEASHQTAMAVAAAEMAKDTLRLTKEKTIEQIGKTKERKIECEVDKAQIEKNPPSKELVEESLLPVNAMNMIFRDPKTGQYFISNMDKVERAAHKANAEMRNDRVWLNDLLYDCGANMSDIAREYYLDYNETGEIYVEDFVRPVKMEIEGHTVFVGTLDYSCKSRWD